MTQIAINNTGRIKTRGLKSARRNANPTGSPKAYRSFERAAAYLFTSYHTKRLLLKGLIGQGRKGKIMPGKTGKGSGAVGSSKVV